MDIRQVKLAKILANQLSGITWKSVATRYVVKDILSVKNFKAKGSTVDETKLNWFCHLRALLQVKTKTSNEANRFPKYQAFANI